MLFILASMSFTVELRGAGTDANPGAGVIRDARRRQLRRRQLAAAVAVALAALGAAIGWLATHSGSAQPPYSRGALRVLRALRDRKELVQPRFVPVLEGGEYGWCLVIGRGGGCPYIPAELVTTVDVGGTEVPGKEQIRLLIGPKVAGVLVNGRQGQMVTLGRLPYGLRVAQITFPKGSGVVYYAESLRDRRARQTSWAKPGRMGARRSSRQDPLVAAPRVLSPRGPCQIRATGLAGLTAEWGRVATTIRPYPHKIAGRAFFSCIDTEYYLNNWPLQTALLVDAQHPGRPPAPIPSMAPISGAPGMFKAPGGWHGEITAVRHGNAWLVVAGGRGLSQRVQVLRHLSARVSESNLRSKVSATPLALTTPNAGKHED